MNSIDDLEKKMWWRHWSAVLILGIIAGVVIWSLLNVGPLLKSWRNKSTLTDDQRKLEKLYREDTRGGLTPEETFSMFISALEKKDFDLASKYFALSKQDQWKKTLIEYEDKGFMKEFWKELNIIKNSWQKVNSKDEIFSHFEYFVSNNGIQSKNEVIFEKYPKGVWKISFL